MIRLISVKCPDCGAALQFEEGRQTAFCSYCGAKILLHNENEYIYRNIDEAGIKQAENDRIYMMKALEMEEKEDKHHRFLISVWLTCTILSFVIGAIMVSTGPKDSDDPGYMLLMVSMCIGIWGWIMLEVGEKKKTKNRSRPGYIQVPNTVINDENIHFTAAAAALKTAGFSSVTAINLGDLRLGIFKKNGSVDSVTIDGESVSSGEWYRKEAQVIITYHGFPE